MVDLSILYYSFNLRKRYFKLQTLALYSLGLYKEC